MKSKSNKNIKELLERALMLAPDERPAFLAKECGGQYRNGEGGDGDGEGNGVRAEVEELLRAHDATGEFLETPAVEIDIEDIAQWADPDAARIGKKVGRYTLERVIASGGMGTVYEGRKADSDEVFAIKMMKPGLVSESAQRRFVHEAGVLSRLDHAGIARIFDVGSHDTDMGAVPFFAMEYVQGALPLTEYARAESLSTRSNLELFLQICRAVEHGHQKGVVHRDLKPSNILVDSTGAVKVIDFGVARVTDDDLAVTTLHTSAGQLIGTLPYMSPEQCAGDPDDIDTRSDVYSLGVVLFDLLTGSLPHDLRGLSIPDAMQIVRDQAPTRASTHNQTLSGDLDTILLKALEKDRDRRYGSVAELNQDIQRHLNHEPILARPPSAMYRMGKFARRNRGVVAASSVATIALVSALGVSLNFAAAESRARSQAQEERDESERQREIADSMVAFFSDDIFGAIDVRQLDHDVTMREVLDVAAKQLQSRYEQDPNPPEERLLRYSIARSYRALGLFDKAEEQQIIGLRLALDGVGPDGLEYVKELQAIGDLRYQRGLYEEALEIYRGTYSSFHRILGPDNDGTIWARGRIASGLSALSRYEEAAQLRREILDTSMRVYGDRGERTLTTQLNLAHSIAALGRSDEARAILEEYIPIMREVLGEDHGTTLMAMNNLAMEYGKAGRNAEAIATIKELITIRTRKHGPEHRSTLQMRENYAHNLHVMGRYEEAKREYSEIVEIADRTRGVDHPDSLANKRKLTFSLAKLGEHEEAVELARWVATRAESAPLVTAVAKTRYSHDLAWRLRDAGRSHEAIPMQESTLVKRKELLGPEHLDTFNATVLLARLYDDVERFEEAAQHLQWAEEVSRRVHGIDHFQYGRVLNALGDHFVKIQSLEEGEQDLLRAHSIILDTRGVHYHYVAEVIESIIRLYEAWDKPEKAEAWRAKLPTE